MPTEDFVAYGVAADDRKEGEFEPADIPEDVTGLERRTLSVLDGRPTAEALERIWAERDLAYVGLEKALDPNQVEAVRAFRVLEVRNLSPKEQVGTNLATRAMCWTPPR